MAISEDSQVLVGADDNNCLYVLGLDSTGKKPGEVHSVLRGHDGRVSSIAISVKKNLIVSASEDGSGKLVNDETKDLSYYYYYYYHIVILWALRSGQYLRSLYNEVKDTQKTSPVDWCAICDDGSILIYSMGMYMMTRYDLAGCMLAQHEFIAQLSAISMDSTLQYIVAGSERGDLCILRARDLLDVTMGDGKCEGFPQHPKLPVGVHCIHVTKDIVFVGCTNGQLLVVGKL